MSTIVKGLKLHVFIVKGEGVSSAIRIFHFFCILFREALKINWYLLGIFPE